MSILDKYIAKKVLGEKFPTAQSVGNDPIERPYAPELNKKLPSTISKDSILPKSIADFPQMPPELQPLAQGLVDKMKKVQELSDQIRQLEKELRESIQPLKDERDVLQKNVTEESQTIGTAIQAIDPNLDLVITYVGDMFIAAQKVLNVSSPTVTMDKGAQLELLKQLMMEVDKDLGQKVISKFQDAIQKFTIQPKPEMQKDLRVWPIPQDKLKGKATRLSTGVDNQQQIHDDLIEAISGLIEIQTTIHDGISALAQNKTIPVDFAAPMAAAASKGLDHGEKIRVQ